jgi:cell division protein FtsQ
VSDTKAPPREAGSKRRGLFSRPKPERRPSARAAKPVAAPAAPPAGPDVDPKIRARRIEVQRDAGRKRLRRLVILGSVAGIGAGLYALTLTPLLDVDTITIEGATHTGDDAVREAVDIEGGDALLSADVDGAARALSRLPWIATADVRRSFPGTIEVVVIEREPVAAIAAKGGGWIVVDRGGRQLAVEKEPAIELLRVAGRQLTPVPGEVAGERFQGSLDLAAVIPPSLRPSIASLWPQEDGTIEATVSLPGGGSAAARFGAPAQLERKLLALAAVLERADLARVTIIDLRVPGAPALTRG